MTALLDFSLHSFAYRHRAWTSNDLEGIGALVSDDADEIEDERDDREDVELSETIDSGDDIEDTEVASEDRRWETYDWGEELKWVCHFSVSWAAQAFEACAIAKLIEDLLSM
jgi:hypothetical protein